MYNNPKSWSGIANLWKIVLKNGKGKLPLPPGELTTELEAQGFVLLPILPCHIASVRHLSCAHADPFDRLLVAQAHDERLTLLTRDAAILALSPDGVVKDCACAWVASVAKSVVPPDSESAL